MTNIRKLDCSIERYEDLADREFEKDCNMEFLDPFWIDHYRDRFCQGVYYYVRAILFGYIKRNPVDSYGINDFVKLFYETHKERLDKMGIPLDYEFNYNTYYNFNPSGLYGYERWCDYNPSIVFSDIRISLPLVHAYGHIIKITDEGFDFIVMENGEAVLHRIVSEKYYKRFLKNLQRLTKHWCGHYSTHMLDGCVATANCKDINLNTHMFNASSSGSAAYRKCLVKWFGR